MFSYLFTLCDQLLEENYFYVPTLIYNFFFCFSVYLYGLYVLKRIKENNNKQRVTTFKEIKTFIINIFY